MEDFVPYGKTPRLFRDVVVTEKLDGTNGLVHVEHYTPSLDDNLHVEPLPAGVALVNGLTVRAGSRNRWLSPDSDNFGFGRWVMENAETLALLGPGYHYGEWWGAGIQRTYGLKEKRFSLFNTMRWSDPATRPTCCHVVPVLYHGEYREASIRGALTELMVRGSSAAPGFEKPEGIIVFHTASSRTYKVTPDDKAKGE